MKTVDELWTAFNSGKSQNSAIAAHCLTTGHDIQLIFAKLLHNCYKIRLLITLEEAETITAKSREDSRLPNDVEATYVSRIVY